MTASKKQEHKLFEYMNSETHKETNDATENAGKTYSEENGKSDNESDQSSLSFKCEAIENNDPNSDTREEKYESEDGNDSGDENENYQEMPEDEYTSANIEVRDCDKLVQIIFPYSKRVYQISNTYKKSETETIFNVADNCENRKSTKSNAIPQECIKTNHDDAPSANTVNTPSPESTPNLSSFPVEVPGNESLDHLCQNALMSKNYTIVKRITFNCAKGSGVPGYVIRGLSQIRALGRNPCIINLSDMFLNNVVGYFVISYNKNFKKFQKFIESGEAFNLSLITKKKIIFSIISIMYDAHWKEANHPELNPSYIYLHEKIYQENAEFSTKEIKNNANFNSTENPPDEDDDALQSTNFQAGDSEEKNDKNSSKTETDCPEMKFPGCIQIAYPPLNPTLTPSANDELSACFRPPEALMGLSPVRGTSLGNSWSIGCIIALIFRPEKTPLYHTDAVEDSTLDVNMSVLKQIFRMLGTPTGEEWSELLRLPEFQCLDINHVLSDHPMDILGKEVSGLLDDPIGLELLCGLLKVDFSERLRLSKAITHP